MSKPLVFLISLLISASFAQVTYSNTLTAEELESYFLGGARVLQVDVPATKELRYQLVDMKDMSNLWSGEVNSRIDLQQDVTARFSVLVSDTFADYCGNTIDVPTIDEAKFEFFFSRLITVSKETSQVVQKEGIGHCIYFDTTFNWGHWTDILTGYQGALPETGWIPVLAFIPNFNIPTGEENTYSGVKDGSAETWLVLLITFNDLVHNQNPSSLTQSEVIELLRDYGINPNP
jgi:hypothetical protein